MTDYFDPITGNQINVAYDSKLTLNLTAPITLSWPTTQSNTLYPVAQNIIIETTTSPSNTITFPDATEASLNYETKVWNLTAGNITLLKEGGTTLATIAAGQTLDVLLDTNATAAGTWQTVVFGAGTSSADAAALAGYGLKAITTTLNSNYLIPIVSSDFTIQLTDRASIKEWATGVGAITLQAGSVYGAGFWFGWKNLPTSGQVTFTPSSGTINGASSYTLQPGNSVFIGVDNNLNWITAFDGIPSYFIPSVLNKNLLSGDTNITLTSQEQANIIQNFTCTPGPLAAPCTINYVPLAGFFLINNLTTQNLTITDGTNNFTVTPSNSIFLKSDGSSVFLYAGMSEAQNLNVIGNLACLDTGNRQVGFKSATTNSITTQIYTLPTNFPSANGGLLTSSTAGVMSFTDSRLFATQAVRGGSQQALNATGTTTLIFNSSQFATTGVNYNTTTGVYTVVGSGIYQFNITANVIFTCTVAGTLNVSIFDGTTTRAVTAFGVNVGDTAAAIVLPALLQLSATNTLTIVFEVVGATIASVFLSQGSSLSISRLVGV